MAYTESNITEMDVSYATVSVEKRDGVHVVTVVGLSPDHARLAAAFLAENARMWLSFAGQMQSVTKN